MSSPSAHARELERRPLLEPELRVDVAPLERFLVLNRPEAAPRGSPPSGTAVDFAVSESRTRRDMARAAISMSDLGDE